MKKLLTALLFAPNAGSQAIDHNLVWGFLLLQFGMAGWSFGSIIQRRKAGKAGRSEEMIAPDELSRGARRLN